LHATGAFKISSYNQLVMPKRPILSNPLPSARAALDAIAFVCHGKGLVTFSVSATGKRPAAERAAITPR
jgi:hypothetical protein